MSETASSLDIDERKQKVVITPTSKGKETPQKKQK